MERKKIENLTSSADVIISSDNVVSNLQNNWQLRNKSFSRVDKARTAGKGSKLGNTPATGINLLFVRLLNTQIHLAVVMMVA